MHRMITRGHAQRARKQGFSLVETGLVLGLLAFAITAAYLAFTQGREDQQLQRQINGATTLMSNIRSVWEGRPDYDGLQTASLASRSLLPKDFSYSSAGPRAITGWNTDLTLNLPAAHGNQMVQMLFADVPARDCFKFVDALAPTVQIVQVGAVTIKDTVSATRVSYGAPAAAAACNDQVRDVRLTFR